MSNEMEQALALYGKRFDKFPDITTVCLGPEHAGKVASKVLEAINRGTPLTAKEEQALEPELEEGEII